MGRGWGLDGVPHRVEPKKLLCWKGVSSVVEHSSTNPKVPGSIPGLVSYWGRGL